MITVAFVGLAGCGKVYAPEELPNAFALPAGTQIEVTPVEDLSEMGLVPGRKFAGVLETPLYHEREKIDPNGEVFADKVLIAPQGTPVYGTVVTEPEPAEGKSRPDLGLHLSKLTLHGGMSFDVKTSPVLKYTKDDGLAKHVSTANENTVLTFTLAEPADVALVIEMRDAEAEKESDEDGPPLWPTTPIPPIS